MQSKNKKVMMWADILLKHPETLEILPDDIYYLNWDYSQKPSEENVESFAKLGKKQIVCPATSSWSRFCENVATEESNITRMIDFGYRHKAVGVLNTNWGDYANPASIDLAMYGIVLGAVKSWTVQTQIDESFYDAINDLLYGCDKAIQLLTRISNAHSLLAPVWDGFCAKYFDVRYGEKPQIKFGFNTEKIVEVQKECVSVINELITQTWDNKEAKEELIICAEGICVLAQLGAKLFGITAEKVVDVNKWLVKYKDKWLKKNKESEISKIEEMLLYIENI